MAELPSGMDPVEVAIVGAGPIGIELGVALKRASIGCVLFEAGQVGHTIDRLFPHHTRFFSSSERIAVAGVPIPSADQTHCQREEYLAYLRSVVEQFQLDIRAYARVSDVEAAADGFTLTVESRARTKEVRARKVVLASGGLSEPRRLDIPGEDLEHVSHFFRDPHAYFGQRVLVVGGMNSAIETALRCHHAGANVTISYRGAAFDPARAKPWLANELTGLIQTAKIRGLLNTVLTGITPTAVHFARTDGGADFEEPFDFVLLQIGYRADMSLCRAAGVELIGPRETPRFNPDTMETDVPGLYLAGTVIGGTQQKFQVFIESCHVHVARIVADLTGRPPPEQPAGPIQPES